MEIIRMKEGMRPNDMGFTPMMTPKGKIKGYLHFDCEVLSGANWESCRIYVDGWGNVSIYNPRHHDEYSYFYGESCSLKLKEAAQNLILKRFNDCSMATLQSFIQLYEAQQNSEFAAEAKLEELTELKKQPLSGHLIDNLTLECLKDVEYVLEAYSSYKIELYIPRDEEGNVIVDGEYDIIIRDKSYRPNTLEVCVLQWVEGIGDAQSLCETLSTFYKVGAYRPSKIPNQQYTYYYIGHTADKDKLFSNLSPANLNIIEGILKAYICERIDFTEPRDDANGIYADTKYELIVKDQSYEQTGYELAVLKWYEDRESTDWLIDCFLPF